MVGRLIKSLDLFFFFFLVLEKRRKEKCIRQDEYDIDINNDGIIRKWSIAIVFICYSVYSVYR